MLNGYEGGQERVTQLWIDCRWCFYSDRGLAVGEARRRGAAVGPCAWIDIDAIGTRRTDHSRTSFQSVDESRPRDGVDQYQDHSWDPVLRTHHPDGGDHADVWLGLDAKGAEPRCRKLSSRAAGEATHPYDQAILNQRRGVWASS